MKLYSKTTKELFGCISFISPLNIFKNIKIDASIKRINYCYVFPQRCYTWNFNEKSKTYYKSRVQYWWFCWMLTICNERTPNFDKLPKQFV